MNTPLRRENVSTVTPKITDNEYISPEERLFRKRLNPFTRWIGGTVAALALPLIIHLVGLHAKIHKAMEATEAKDQKAKIAKIEKTEAERAEPTGFEVKFKTCRPRITGTECMDGEIIGAGFGGDICCPK